MTPNEFDVLTRLDLHTFIHRAFAELNPGQPFLDNWHVEMLAAEATAIFEGRERRTIINLAPRNLKTICISVAAVAWMLGHKPEMRIMVVSYAAELAEKLARDCRQLMTSPWYMKLFPATRLSATRSSVGDFETTAGGGRLSVSRGGSITGRGADLIIIDDPMKSDEAMSDHIRKGVNDWVGHTLLSRLNSKAHGAIMLIMQRLHELDLTGSLLDQGIWRHVNLPAIAQYDEVWRYSTPFGNRIVRRAAGDALHSEREPLHILEEIRKAQGDYHFAAQYLQMPAPPGGGYIKFEWFGRYARHQLPDKFDEVIQSWDTANKATELSDYSVCTTWGRKGTTYYLLAIDRKKLEYPQLKTLVVELRRREQAQRVIIEDSASGQQLLQELRQSDVWVDGYKPQRDKIMRVMTVGALIQSGAVLIPETAPWLEDFEHEITMFPNGTHDDQVDSLSQALNWFQNAGREPGFITWCRADTERMYREEFGSEFPTVCIKGPPACNMCSGLRGDLYTRDAEGLFLVREEDAKIFLALPGWVEVRRLPTSPGARRS